MVLGKLIKDYENFPIYIRVTFYISVAMLIWSIFMGILSSSGLEIIVRKKGAAENSTINEDSA